MSIIYCPVCGKNIRYTNTCSRCGYEEKTDYVAYPTLSMIGSSIESVETRQQEYKRKEFMLYLDQYLCSAINNNIDEIQTLLSNRFQVAITDNQKKVADLSENRFRKTIEQILNFDSAFQENIYFGSYKQKANSNEKKPIEWIVLDKKENKLLLISKYALDCKPYNDKFESTTWEKCTLRAWLNSDFIADAFSSQELGKIVETKVTAVKNPAYDTDPGNDTKDKVFLLSIEEAEKYFLNDEERQCKPTVYIKENGVYVDDKNGNCWWWLRSPGFNDYGAAGVFSFGSVNFFGSNVFDGNTAVRPAMWIDP